MSDRTDLELVDRFRRFGDRNAFDRLVEYDALSEPERAKHPQYAHLQVCSRCQLVLLHMAEPDTAAASSPLKWLLPLAAVALLAVAVTLIDREGGTLVPATNETVRGTGLQPTAPAGAVEMIREFSWQSPIRAERYRVIVKRGSTVVWQTETTGLTVAPPPSGVLRRNLQYEWRVEAIDREGNVRMASPPQPFLFF